MSDFKDPAFWTAKIMDLAVALVGYLILQQALTAEQGESFLQIVAAALAIGVPGAIALIEAAYLLYKGKKVEALAAASPQDARAFLT